MAYIFKVVVLLSLYNKAYADPSKMKEYSVNKSLCIVKSSAGEYPVYTVFRKAEKTPFYSPNSDGISSVVFSDEGKYIAFNSSEIDSFGITIISCVTKKNKTYLDGKIVTLEKFILNSQKKHIQVKIYTPMTGNYENKIININF